MALGTDSVNGLLIYFQAVTAGKMAGHAGTIGIEITATKKVGL